MTTGTVIRKMIRSTSMTSTSGVVLMSDIGVSSPLSDSWPTFMPILAFSYRVSDVGSGPGGAPGPARSPYIFFGPAFGAPAAVPVAAAPLGVATFAAGAGPRPA
jgi:hypothetical protein